MKIILTTILTIGMMTISCFNDKADIKTCKGIKFTWNDVINPKTGKTWMDRNLGANRVATSLVDSLAYGDLYQWGRKDDGHQCRKSNTTNKLINNDSIGNSHFIIADEDWRNFKNDSLWQGVSGTNNPCPKGYRIPTKKEWETEVESWISKDAEGAYGSVLKLPAAGSRLRTSGGIGDLGDRAYYWSSTIESNEKETFSYYQYFDKNKTMVNAHFLATGISVRCIKD